MEINLVKIQVQDLVKDYKDNEENGVIGYGGMLNIRPAFQREFVYTGKQREAVIKSILKNFPLNTMYWATTDYGDLELLDGQQRTMSICQYVNGDFSVNNRFFHNLTETEKEQILNYELMVYVCKGNDLEKLDWFKIINIGGERLTEQELRNAVYTGPWLTDAKRYFSKSNCPAYSLASKYMKGSPIRQDYLETVIRWHSSIIDISIEEYMAIRQKDTNASPLWLYFQAVIAWVKTIFTKYRKEMSGVEWGLLYNKYSEIPLDPKRVEEEIVLLLQDDEVQNHKGIYEYILTRNEKYLNLRSFTDNEKRRMYKKQQGICPHCKREKREKIKWELSEMEADHITPWCEGGKTVIENGQMLCKEHNRRKSNK
ncbi:MAG: DUF262 domain-containing protein [Clostridia bacterium]|nr:DUF262 domain-containing protein [Clostridia bacterium]